MNINVGAEIKDKLEDEINAWSIMSGALSDMNMDEDAQEIKEHISHLRERYKYLEENNE